MRHQGTITSHNFTGAVRERVYSLVSVWGLIITIQLILCPMYERGRVLEREREREREKREKREKRE